MRVLATVVFAVLALPLAAAQDGYGKEGVRARLSAPVPVDAAPGKKVTISWTLGYRDGQGRWRPGFDACGVFVRLLSASPGASTLAFDSGGKCRAHPGGNYAATATVPKGGIGKVEIGLSGTTDVFFPLERGSPAAATTPSFRTEQPASPASSPSGVLLATTLASLCALAAVAAALRRRARA